MEIETEKLKENNENCGAGKRKNYKRKFSDIREKTPADSGFKEPSENSDPLTVISIHSTDDIKLQNITARASKRRKVESEDITLAKVDENILKTFLIKKNIKRAREDIQTTMSRWKPQVELFRMSPCEITRLSNNWRFLENVKTNDTIEFRFEILAERESPDLKKHQVFIKWLPPGILEDGWVDQSSLPQNGIKQINVQNMNWRQKLNVRDKLLNYSCVDKESSRDPS